MMAREKPSLPDLGQINISSSLVQIRATVLPSMDRRDMEKNGWKQAQQRWRDTTEKQRKKRKSMFTIICYCGGRRKAGKDTDKTE